MKYQLKTKDGKWAWVYENGDIMNWRLFNSSKEAQDWHYKTYGGLADHPRSQKHQRNATVSKPENLKLE